MPHSLKDACAKVWRCVVCKSLWKQVKYLTLCLAGYWNHSFHRNSCHIIQFHKQGHHQLSPDIDETISRTADWCALATHHDPVVSSWDCMISHWLAILVSTNEKSGSLKRIMVRGKGAWVSRPWFKLDFSGDNWWCPWQNHFPQKGGGGNLQSSIWPPPQLTAWQ